MHLHHVTHDLLDSFGRQPLTWREAIEDCGLDDDDDTWQRLARLEARGWIAPLQAEHTPWTPWRVTRAGRQVLRTMRKGGRHPGVPARARRREQR